MKLSIGRKIAAGYALAVAALLIIGVVLYNTTNRLDESADDRARAYKVIVGLERSLSALKDSETGSRGFTITGEESYVEPYEEAVREIAPLMKELRALIRDPEVQRSFDSFEPLTMQKLDHGKQTIEIRRTKGFEAATQYIRTGQGKKIMDDLRRIAGEMETDEDRVLQQRIKDVNDNTRMALAVILYGISASVMLMAAVGFFITKNITGPVNEIAAVSDRIAEGDVSATPREYDRSDEVGALARAFNRVVVYQREMARVAHEIASGNLAVEIRPRSEKDLLGQELASMVKSLRGINREVQEAIGVLASSASEILAVTSQTAAGSSETAAAVSQTITTVEEVRQTSILSSQKASYVSDAAQKAAQVAQLGRRTVEELIEGMNRVREQMESIATSIVKLSEQSQAIGEINATVGDLAEQSNLLAVNAAIEAAKAGDQGKGFAVVAGEIRSLAERSKQATSQVRTILLDVQRAVSGAVMVTEQGSKAVEAGVERSVTSGEAIRTLSDSIAESAQAATQIATSSQQQIVGMEQVAAAMESIKEASAQNAAGCQQAEVTARGLNELGQKLKQLVGRYKV
ncbi:MAG: CHASE3 domain-containing protein [Acidobacteriota bacterium]